MRSIVWLPLVLSLLSLSVSPAWAIETAPPEKPGLNPVGSAYFPVPEGIEWAGIENGNFERSAEKAEGWEQADIGAIVSADAPEGKRFWRIPETVGARSLFLTSSKRVPVEANQWYLASMWLRSKKDITITFSADTPRYLRGLSAGWHGAKSTGGEWKRVGVYFRMPTESTSAQIDFRIKLKEGTGAVDLDDVRLRKATQEEYAAAWDAWRKQFPPRDTTPRPGDGKHMASAIRKLEGRGVPGKPFTIWAIGSSYQNFLGHGETQIRIIRERFPNAPEIHYKKHLGNATSWQYNHGWVKQFIAAENPDVICVYTLGQTEDMEAMLRTIRSLTTADVIVPSMHWRLRGKDLWGKSEGEATTALRKVCKTYGVEFVENRREWAEYIRKHDYELVDLLHNRSVHQNTEGRVIINENIARHYARCDDYAYDPDERERRIDKSFKAARKGERIEVPFTGNRIELVGRRVPGGGTARVSIDGKPAEEVSAFYMTYIDSGPDNAGRAWPRRDKSPHCVELGENIVPQTWTITMTSDTGDYKLTGSVTGEDGEGNVLEAFTSESGQIAIDPRYWRGNRTIRRGPNKGKMGYGSKKGDIYFFEVKRGVVSEVSFAADGEAASFVLPVARMLDNGKHRLELIAEGDGPIEVTEFWAFEPPLKRKAAP